MNLDTLSDMECYGLARALLSAKLSSDDSALIGGVPVVNQVLGYLMAREYSDPIVARSFAGYRNRDVSAEWCRPFLKAMEHAIQSGRIEVGSPKMWEMLSDYLYPYEPDQRIRDWVVGQL